MRRRLSELWEFLSTSVGFLPVLMLLATALLQQLVLWVDQRWGEQVQRLGWVYRGGPESALDLLTTLIGAIITVTGVIFSVTIVSLTLVSQQLGPRLLRQFRSDKGIQITLGTLLSTFFYCLLVLWTLQPFAGSAPSVPRLSLTAAALLSLCSFLMLIFYIHHVAKMIQADYIIADVSQDLHRTITHFYPEDAGGGAKEGDLAVELPEDFEQHSWSLCTDRRGYLQTVDQKALIQLASKHDLVIRLNFRAGQFVTKGGVMALAWPQERCGERVRALLAEAYGIGSTRTPTQDVEFAVNQLVEMALRALSPGMNDAFTAIAAVDYLGAALSRCAALPPSQGRHHDAQGRLRLISRPLTFSGLMGAAFDQVRQNAAENVAVAIRVLEALSTVMGHARDLSHGQVVLHHAREMREAILAHTFTAADRSSVEECYQEVERRLVALGGQRGELAVAKPLGGR